jgi:hypothetical protein
VTAGSIRGGARVRNMLPAVLVALVLTLFMVRFAAVGWQRILLNTNSALGDQDAYLQLGLDLRERGVLSDGTRNPLYPALLATFATREWQYFTYAKFLSLALGLISIPVVFLIGYRLFDLPTGLLSAFLLSINMEFVLHSTYVLTESLLVLCVMCAWWVMIRALQHVESTFLWGMAGGLGGLAYLAKGSGQLLVLCFVVAALLLHGPILFRQRTLWVFLATYALIAFPLWIYNWRAFGSPAFNLAITHQMWMDTWEQNFVSDVETLPTAWTYWQTHSWQEAWARAWKGLTDMRFFLAKMLWPARSLAYDQFLLSEWSGVALAVIAVGLLAARRRVALFCQRNREAVILTAFIGVVFYGLFSWYIVIVPIPIRFMLPLLPILSLFVAVSLVGTGRLILTTPKLPVWSKVAISIAVTTLVLVTGRWFLLSGLANARAFWQSPFEADATYNSYSEQPLLWVRSGHATGSVGVLVGPGNSLPTWRHSDFLRYVRFPADVKAPRDLDVFLNAEDVDYIIVDTDMVSRRRVLADHLRGVRQLAGDRASFDTWPLDWALGFAYPEMPCEWCVFRRMVDGVPSHATNYTLGGAIRLAGYDVDAERVGPGCDVTISLYWESLSPVDTDYTVFTQLLGPDRQLHGQVDRQPVYGQWPTSRWQPGQRLVDKFVIRVGETAPIGEYLVLVGLYDLVTGRRLPIEMEGEQLPDDAIVLHHVSIEVEKDKK